MMTEKMRKRQSLQDFLREEQEPFRLNKFIEDRRGSFKKTNLQTSLTEPTLNLQRKHDPSFLAQKRIQSSIRPANFTCKSLCFLSVTKSPDIRKPPAALLNICSPSNRAPRRSGSTNAVFLPVSPKTAALLLEAALRVYKPPSPKPSKTSIEGRRVFGPLLTRLMSRYKKANHTDRLDTRRHRHAQIPENCSSRNALSPSDQKKISFSSESIKANLISASPCEDDEVEQTDYNSRFSCDHYGACSDSQTPDSPFHFVLVRSQSPDDRTSEISSPATSSPSHNKEDRKDDCLTESPSRFNRTDETVAETTTEEDKEQCSPVSVLDPPFDDVCDEDDGQIEEYDGFDLDCSYAIVQRKKKLLLKKIRSFEKLAGLNPVELENRMIEPDEDGDCDISSSSSSSSAEEEPEDAEVTPALCIVKETVSRFIMEELQVKKLSRDMQRLVLDVIEEEKERNIDCDDELMATNVCSRFGSWKELEQSRIDMMMAEIFLKREDEWEKVGWLVEEASAGIESDIVEQLVLEFSENLEGSDQSLMIL